jgi:cytoskeletal protein RodZ
MSNFFYYDTHGGKQGPYNVQQLKVLVGRGIITPTTLMESDTGVKEAAGQVSGLFYAPPPKTPRKPKLSFRATTASATKTMKSLFTAMLGFLLVLVLALAVAGVLWWSVCTVNGWRENSFAPTPVVQNEDDIP